MKTIQFLPAFVYLGILSILSACGTVYAPNAINVPLFHEKGEISLHIDSQSNAQIAMAASDHLGIMVNGAFPSYQGENQEEDSKGSLVEIGVGYFNAKTKNIIADFYVGAGTGTVELNQLATNGSVIAHLEAKGNKLFLQPSIGYSHPYFDMAISSRFSVIKYADVTYNGFSVVTVETNGYSNMENTTWMFLEPALTLRGGYKFVKAQLQLGKTLKLTDKDLKFSESFNSIGLTFDIGKWYKK